jgi:hypothetical protein
MQIVVFIIIQIFFRFRSYIFVFIFTANIFHLQAVENRPFVYLYRNGCFFVTDLETFQIQGVEVSTGGSIESNVTAFEAF